jgi:hypothetical protein
MIKQDRIRMAILRDKLRAAQMYYRIDMQNIRLSVEMAKNAAEEMRKIQARQKISKRKWV